jgi:basic membrane protein A and related proteins
VVGVKKSLRVALALVLVFSMMAMVLAGCTGTGTTTGTTTATPPATPALRAAMVTDVGGLGDKSFNDLSWAGLQKAQADLGIEVKYLESKVMTDYESNLTQLASAGYSPIFAVGFLMQDAVTKMATSTPNTNFGGIDIFIASPPKNFVGLTFKENEAGYLAGVVAGLATKSNFDSRLNAANTIGFVGGMEIPPVVKFQAGFIAGAKSVNPTVKVISLYAGKFDDQAKGKELGLSLISQGADVVFAAAGQTGIGTFNACQESKKALFIGVDSDQFLTLTNPGDTILTSAVKRIDIAVFSVIKSTLSGAFPGGQNLSFGLKEDGVGLAPFHDFEAKVPQAIKDAVAKATADIKAGTVVVPETVK